MASAEWFLEARMRANHARRQAKLWRPSHLFHTLVRVSEAEAARYEKAAAEELAYMAAEAAAAGTRVTFPIANGWSIVAEP